jgi:hypothetical protein
MTHTEIAAQTEKLKQDFRSSMRILIPQGLGKLDLLQWRDMCRIYSLGWVESLKFNNGISGTQFTMNFLGPIMQEVWLPDVSWKWWD